jgi:hypothetical protein
MIGLLDILWIKMLICRVQLVGFVVAYEGLAIVVKDYKLFLGVLRSWNTELEES